MSEELVNRSKQLHAALASFLAQATGLQQTPTTPTPISQLPSQQSPAHGSGFQSHANRADGALTDVPLTLGHVAAAAVAPGGEKARQEEAGAKQQELVVSLGGPEAAVLCVEAAVYDFLELLQQHAQLMSAYEEVQQAEAEEGGQTAAGQSQAGGDPLAALQLCMQVGEMCCSQLICCATLVLLCKTCPLSGHAMPLKSHHTCESSKLWLHLTCT